jgi:VCBS repeat-containing protein
MIWTQKRWTVVLFGPSLVLFGLLGLLLAAVPAHADPNVFTVDRSDDPFSAGDPCTNAVGDCSLRGAIAKANDHANFSGPDEIRFDIPASIATGCDAATGVCTISPRGARLPTITEQVIIDGYSQPGASPNTAASGTNAVLKIVISGASAPEGSDGLLLGNGAIDSTIRGLVINGFKTDNNGNGGRGIALLNVSNNRNNSIEGNFIGTNANGTSDVGNGACGICIHSDQSTGNTIGGIGRDKRNLISGNDGSGVEVGGFTGENTVRGNLIGTDRTGTADVGNGIDGLAVDGSHDNVVLNNRIAFNRRNGVTLFSGTGPRTGNRILNNSIHDNHGMGIDLGNDGVTPNDPFDQDPGSIPGPNGFQNFPVISPVTDSGGSTTIAGTLHSTANRTFLVQLFSSETADPSGHGEGQTLLGEASATTDPDGDASFAFTSDNVGTGEVVSATATNPEGDTSEFSAAVEVAPPPTADDDSFATREDATLNVPAPGVLQGDTDNDPLTVADADGGTSGVQPVAGPSNGALTLNADGSFAYTPNANYNGQDSFTYRATDGATASNTAAVEISVAPVNDAPSFAKGPNQTIAEDSGARSVSGWATALSPGPADESGQSLSFLVANSNTVLFAAQPKVSPSGTLSFTPKKDASGSATVSVRIKDDGGTANGGVNTSLAQTFTVRVTPVNDAPTVTPISPAPASTTTDTTPRISAVARDIETDLAKGNVKLFVDGVAVAPAKFTYDAATDRLTHTPAVALSFAGHTVTVVTTDAQGKTTTKQWGFKVVRP